MDYEKIRSSISAMNFAPSGKYTAKLDFDRRCEILALYRTGVSRTIIAEAYGLNRRTVTHIYNPHSTHYKSVREEEKRLGTEEFLKKYLTEHAYNRIKGLARKDDGTTEREAEKPTQRARKNFSRYQGVHMISNENLNMPHRILIDWVEDGVDSAGPGWYYRDLDSAAPDEWRHNGSESLMSSKACLDFIKLNLVEL